jgi:hypothetical protein
MQTHQFAAIETILLWGCAGIIDVSAAPFSKGQSNNGKVKMPQPCQRDQMREARRSQI